MKAQLAAYIEKEQLRQPHQKMLLACSGGLDSTVLAHLLQQLSIPFALAHMNYRLRGSDSDADQVFVEELAKQLAVPFFTQIAPIDKATLQGESVQMKARDLRYEWLEQVREVEGYDLIATAHHADDNAETILLNLTKGTGIHGLHGILPKNARLIRPLLFASRKELQAYAEAQHLSYREDTSNATTDYQRNFLRHEVIPKLQEINPSFIATMQANTQRWRMAEQLYAERLDYYRTRLFDHRKEEIYIPLRKLLSYPFPAELLYALLNEYGFNATQLQQMIELPVASSGQVVQSVTHRLIKHRRFLILATLQERVATHHWIDKETKQLNLHNGRLTITAEDWSPEKSIPKEAHIAVVDANKLQWPLELRKWKKGDYCYPLGMTKRHSNKVGKKKLSDLFTDLKLSTTDKENAWVLTSGSKIVWVAPYRLDDRFKVTGKTEKVYRFSWDEQV